jgi:hypothetical protein
MSHHDRLMRPPRAVSLTPDDDRRIAEAAASGESLRHLAREWSVSRQSIRRALRRAGRGRAAP